MKTEGLQPAFPMPVEDDRDCHGRLNSGYGGLTKRELFAALAMQGMTSNNSIPVELVAAWSVQYADALLAELAKEAK